MQHFHSIILSEAWKKCSKGEWVNAGSGGKKSVKGTGSDLQGSSFFFF